MGSFSYISYKILFFPFFNRILRLMIELLLIFSILFLDFFSREFVQIEFILFQVILGILTQVLYFALCAIDREADTNLKFTRKVTKIQR